jgi:hypothetical protein
MINKETQDRNKQIALMLGWKEATLEYKLKWCAVPTEERLNRLDQDYVPILMKENKDPLWSSSLLWHSDWNWLMEAVEFIESKGYEIGIFANRVEIITTIEENRVYETGGKTKKEAVFIAVSDFAKNHNLYNKKL